MAEVETETGKIVTGSGGQGSLAKKFVVAFAAMFVIPMLLAVYLFNELSRGVPDNPLRLGTLFFFTVLLGTAGFLVCRSVLLAMHKTLRETEAVVGGDLTRRLACDSKDEISQLARNFNQITSRLQETIDRLEASRRQIQTLLSQVCASIAQPVEVEEMFGVLLRTLLSVTGLDRGCIFLLAPGEKTLSVAASAGIPEELCATVIPVGSGIVGWVASHGQVVTTSESMPWGRPEALSPLESTMPWGVHVPLGTPGKMRGVLSIGTAAGRKRITGEDLLLIQNLAAQVSVAIENAALKDEMEKTYVQTVAALAAAVEARDKYTRGHSKRVTELAVEIARRMDLPESFLRDLEAAGLLHDIGKIGIPDRILHNVGPLPAEGVEYIHGHPIGGENILKPVGSLARLCPIVRHHHERYDGRGYPDRLKGEQIPLGARIVAVADSFDAMISDRSYKRKRSREEAIDELVRCRGTQFDPRCVDHLVAYLAENPRAGALTSAG